MKEKRGGVKKREKKEKVKIGEKNIENKNDGEEEEKKIVLARQSELKSVLISRQPLYLNSCEQFFLIIGPTNETCLSNIIGHLLQNMGEIFLEELIHFLPPLRDNNHHNDLNQVVSLDYVDLLRTMHEKDSILMVKYGFLKNAQCLPSKEIIGACHFSELFMKGVHHEYMKRRPRQLKRMVFDPGGNGD
ncbi:hypothetical protein Lal_00030148 [Lupinus albus]|nr:hypothetical protein Lal_00030148 [Lupinus albus]